jgi:hypothetical protein
VAGWIVGIQVARAVDSEAGRERIVTPAELESRLNLGAVIVDVSLIVRQIAVG